MSSLDHAEQRANARMRMKLDYDYIDKKATIADGCVELANTPDSVNRNMYICHVCGDKKFIKYPIDAMKMVQIGDEFVKKHKRCQKKK